MQLRRSGDHRPSIATPGLNGPRSSRGEDGYRQDASLIRGYDEENAVALTDLAEDTEDDSEEDGMTRLSTHRGSRRERERAPILSPRLAR